jgi:hypothetical protein
MPSTAFNAMRRNSQTGNSRNTADGPPFAASDQPSSTEPSAATNVTWFAVMPAAAIRRTIGRSSAWKRGFSV